MSRDSRDEAEISNDLSGQDQLRIVMKYVKKIDAEKGSSSQVLHTGRLIDLLLTKDSELSGLSYAIFKDFESMPRDTPGLCKRKKEAIVELLRLLLGVDCSDLRERAVCLARLIFERDEFKRVHPACPSKTFQQSIKSALGMGMEKWGVVDVRELDPQIMADLRAAELDAFLEPDGVAKLLVKLGVARSAQGDGAALSDGDDDGISPGKS